MENNSKNAIPGDLESLMDSVSLDDEVKSSKKSIFETISYNFSKFNSSRIEFLQKTPLLSYSIKRILYAFVTLYLAVIVMYALLRFVTPDTVYISDLDLGKLGIKVGSDEYYTLIDNRKKIYGAYGPLISQIFIYLRNITPFIPKEIILNPVIDSAGNVTGDPTTMWFYLGVIFGKATGLQQGSLVQDAFKEAIPVSFKLGGLAVLLSYLLGVPLGILAAKNKEKWKDSAINGTSLIISAIPALVIIKLLYEMSIYYFGAGARWEDSTVFTKMFPLIGVMLLIMPMIIVNTRRFVIDEMTSDYTKFAMSKGLSSRYVFYVHIFRNAGIRMIKTVPEIFIVTLFGSSILVEQHWVVPGMSKFILYGIADRDTFLILGYIFVSASAGVFSSLIGDLLLAVLDPRIKLTK
ncbi:oligopeptide ABC transporter permease OppB [Spiroplasma culicicola]|uniref:Oligopeptide ABC transporter permease n=1 Tax=Spiroplasma culicicola AES-1 TaxID=1276246 RepID=W6A898_9MOLU|nr:oligopeptide ABC transporter permease OppB [Spiroplasma culicicola]AHI53120.1 oligopeptide ABC transporter permease [Spiroplasma culicicola AES-1]